MRKGRKDDSFFTPFQTYSHMLVVNRSPRGDILGVAYLPEGALEINAGLSVKVERNANTVIVHLPNTSLEVTPPVTLNFTKAQLSIIPLEHLFERDSKNVAQRVREIENAVFSRELLPRVRRFLRYYGAYLALKNLFHVPETFREDISMSAARLLGMPLGEILMKKEKVLEECIFEINDTLRRMTPEELASLVSFLA